MHVPTPKHTVQDPMRSGDVANGFPPCAANASSPYHWQSGDLLLRERGFVASTQGMPKRLIRREHGKWWRSILAALKAFPESAADEPVHLEWSGPKTSSLFA